MADAINLGDSNDGPADVVFPIADASYMNVSLRIDPAWPFLDSFYSSLAQQGFPGKLVTPSAGGFVFTFVDLDEISEDVQANYATTDVLGRAESFKTYTGASNRTIPMTFHFHCQGFGLEVDTLNQTNDPGDDFSSSGGTFNGDPTPQNDRSAYDEVVAPTRFIEILKQPVQDPTTGLAFAPPPLLLVIGQLLVARVVLTDASVTWNAPFEPTTMYPHGSTIRCTFTVVRNLPPGTQGDYGTTDRISRFVDFPYATIQDGSLSVGSGTPPTADTDNGGGGGDNSSGGDF